MKTPFSPVIARPPEWILWCAMAITVTGVLFAFREEIGGAHVALSYLLVVLGASARGGRRLGFVLTLLCFLAFDFHTDPRAENGKQDWISRPALRKPDRLIPSPGDPFT